MPRKMRVGDCVLYKKMSTTSGIEYSDGIVFGEPDFYNGHFFTKDITGLYFYCFQENVVKILYSLLENAV